MSSSARPPTARAPASATETNGCDSGSLPDRHAGRRSTGAAQPGTLVYNSWLTMQGRGEANASACQYNDFALVKLDPADAAKRQPVGARLRRPDRPAQRRRHDDGHKVLSYGNSILRQGITVLSPKYGIPGPGDLRRGLEPHGLHGHARHPG